MSNPNPRPIKKIMRLADPGYIVILLNRYILLPHNPFWIQPAEITNGLSAIVSSSDSPCPSLILKRYGPSHCAGIANISIAKDNRNTGPRGHSIAFIIMRIKNFSLLSFRLLNFGKGNL